MEHHQAEWQGFIRDVSPWLFADPGTADPGRFQRDPRADALIANAVNAHLADYQFRRASRAFRSTILGEPLFITTSRGSKYMAVSLRLELPSRSLVLPLGYSFLSGAVFEDHRSALLESQLHGFFTALAVVFPGLLEALSLGMRAQDQAYRTLAT